VKKEDPAIGPYTIHALLGSGGMCNVRLGLDKNTHTAVAVKRMQLDLPAHCYPRLDVEAAILRALRGKSSYLVEYIHYGTDNQGRKALVMELVERGVTLDRFVANQPHKRVAPLSALHILTCIAEGLAAAHALGIVHRDLKADNVLIATVAGVIQRVVIIDFGLAKVDPPVYTGERLTPVPAVFGTMEYMSPEQYEDTSSVDARTDVYAMALLLYYLITGKDYYPRANRAVKETHKAYLERTQGQRRSPPKMTPDSHIPSAVWRLIRLGLSYDPDYRPKDALAFLKLLRVTMRALRRDASKKPRKHNPPKKKGEHKPAPLKTTRPSQNIDPCFLTRKEIFELVIIVIIAIIMSISITALIFLPSSH
jgi:serine/threonine-protein kinase